MSEDTTAAASLTVVFVHGAFADASGWNGVIEQLQADGVQVMAPANPLRGISIDSAYIASYLVQIPGPVLAVGHSYGGAVITNAATNANNVVGLVYVAAFAPDEGARLEDLAFLGGGRYRRQGGRFGCRAVDGRARRGYDHRGRGLPRDNDVAATGGNGRDPPRAQGRRVAHQRVQGAVLMFEGFQLSTVDTAQASIRVRHG